VALSADTAVAGAPGADGAYVFVREEATWNLESLLTASSGSDGLGRSVACSGETAVVGAPLDDFNGGNQVGSAHVFARSGTTWSETAVLQASDGVGDDFFGHSVAISGDLVLCGAPDEDHDLCDALGAAYAFRLLPAAAGYCTAGASASGCQALLSSSGSASAQASSGFVVSATSVEGGKDGHFYFGTNGRQANPWGNGTSYQCVVPPTKRATALIGSGTAGQCDGAFAEDLNALWCPTCPKPHKNPGAGAIVQVQLWYRDPQSTSNQTTSLSDALESGVGPR
jgi:hypothetical protein